jgi:hypothetical protein
VRRFTGLISLVCYLIHTNFATYGLRAGLIYTINLLQGKRNGFSDNLIEGLT